MTNEQKSRIAELRQAGFSYGKIGQFLDIPKNTIKTYCNRNNLASAPASSESDDRCKECGKPLVQKAKTKRRIFCCPECRKKWWREHPEQINRRSAEECICAGCGISFVAYKNTNRRYCSHACYIRSRFGGGKDE